MLLALVFQHVKFPGISLALAIGVHRRQDKTFPVPATFCDGLTLVFAVAFSRANAPAPEYNYQLLLVVEPFSG